MQLVKPQRLRLTPKEYAEQRKLLGEMFDWRCAKCGKILPLQRNHIRKRSQLGGDEIENAQLLCIGCHDQKDNVARSKSKYWN